MIAFHKIYNIWHLMYIVVVFVLYLMTMLAFLPPVFMHVSLLMAFFPISYVAVQKLRDRKIGTEFFLTIATIISLVGNQEKSMNLVLLIMLIAEYLEDLIAARTHEEIKSLINLIPKKILIKHGDTEKSVEIDEVSKGDLVIVKTGYRIPVDGVIVQGSAGINEASLTGESALQERKMSQQVFAGTFVESGSIVIKTEKVGDDTFFGKIVLLVQSTDSKKAKISLITDKIALYLVPIMLILIAATWFFTHNLGLVTTLLVFGSPLELTLITPLAILSGIMAAFRNGILVKGGLVLEKFYSTDTIIFDKTGTLTMGTPKIIKIKSFDQQYDEKKLLTIAAIAEKRSDHIWAKAILAKAQQEGIVITDPEDYKSLSGHGVEITYDNQRWFLGNRHFIESPEHGNAQSGLFEQDTKDAAYSSFYIAASGRLYGAIYIADTVREDAADTIAKLKDLGLKNIILLSGDKDSVAKNIASVLNIPQAYGEVFPDQKLLMITNLQQKNHIVAMVGDGINDAPALKCADVGIAMGAMAMEPAIEAADIVLITNNLSKIVFVYALSKEIFNVVKQNLLIGFTLIHGMGLLLTFLGYVDPFRAALFHAFSDVIILINSVKLIRFKIA